MSIIQALFLDIGGVLLTNGWDHALRKATAEAFQVDYDEMDSRHQLIFDTYETGKMTFDEYLKKVIFFVDRPYSMQDVKQYIFGAAKPYEDMIALVKEVKERHNLKVGVVSNEGRELAVDRIHRFNLPSFVDFFVVSSFVHFRKPDPDIYHLAIDVVQVPPSKIAYIDDRKLLIEVGKGLGLQGIHHTGCKSTESALNHLLNVLEIVR
ncbi:HAD family hydrolase [Chlamydiota bacterium]